jgi:mono/diheme cytochrome c family protein
MFPRALIFTLTATLALTSCSEEKPAGATVSGSKGPSAPDGMAVFRKYCVACHGADGKLGLNGAKDLSKSQLTLEERIQIITKGKNLMTPFGEILSEAEIKAVADYSVTLKQ